MAIEFEYPKFRYGNNPCAVYKMKFDTGRFYIGSSEKVKTRICVWKAQIDRGDVRMKVIIDALQWVKKVTWEIVEYADDKDELLRLETHYLQLYKDDDMSMNRCPTAYSPVGLKPLPVHLQKIKTIKVKKPQSPPKPVNKFDLAGNFISTFPSIGRAAASVGVKQKTVGEHVTFTRVRGINGYVFRLVGDVRPYTVHKKKTATENFLKCGKPIIDLNTGIFWTSDEVAILLGINRRYVHRLLSEERKLNTTSFRYA